LLQPRASIKHASNRRQNHASPVEILPNKINFAASAHRANSLVMDYGMTRSGEVFPTIGL